MWKSRASLRPVLKSVLVPSTRRLRSNISSPDNAPYPQTHSVQQGFAQHPIFVLNVAKRFLKFSLIGLILLGSTTAVAFEATHAWVENVELKMTQDDTEVSAWEWDLDAERWNGEDKQGGTDPGLGFRGRHCVRGAWMALHWGVGESTAVISSDASNTSDSLLGPRGLVVIDPRLVRAEDGLRTAVEIAERRSMEGKLQPWTLSRLLSLHASVLERMGKESSLVAKDQYERAWATQPEFTKESTRLAMKLGDLHFRIGDNESAMVWWARGAYLTRGTSIPPEVSEFPASSLQDMPPSPSAQRTLLSILASCSASYARSAKFKEGRSLDEGALNLIRSVRHPENTSSVSAAHALHALTLLHRSSVFCIHRAEVSYALKENPSVSIQWLSTAAQSSERVARALATGLHQNKPLSSSYTESPFLKQPANRLLREARRTAVEAWNLLGVLNEDKSKQEALQCYKRAVEWASKPDTFGEPAEETLAKDWAVVWGNYTRLSGLRSGRGSPDTCT